MSSGRYGNSIAKKATKKEKRKEKKKRKDRDEILILFLSHCESLC